MAKNELKQYIEAAMAQGSDKASLQDTLTGAGWPNDLVKKTLSEYVGLDARGLLIPAPKTRFHQVIRDIFFNLLALVTLSMSAFSLGYIIFNLTDSYFPDEVAMSRDYFGQSMAWHVAQLAVTFPIYLCLARWLSRDIERHPDKRDSLVRKLLIYFILFVTALTGLGDLTTMLYHFLSGELTARFIIKAATVLGIAGTVFLYYLREMKQDDAALSAGPAAPQKGAT